MKQYSPVSNIERKPILSFKSQAAMQQSLSENDAGSVGVKERGEHTKEHLHTWEV